ncbi:putative 3beta-hydroxysteroid-dehydrogenase [Monocercomonoides exilis]|uniref:putative 3beta-hydroxysteroid-dehydrogenase n=1 Tax=Monocercomonoides exilis TaxID=2049356 RepID=UPI00355A1B2E|nr:putative 3beta-hydroxysteroid-dehydrogenase [Monocercomonoides exilis]|eukprot:MONOS_10250.1-p1 / transcript=MONOS_10250.1 / gene=MONOS_10250 / organism=Monocercomonoides_exilis_PA203 / gene_product=3beta-hydroxysteroid-dehydrogenase / transcript_product=3beta-hydroxysteroid-dehydrogenase / location=Mono_scaffold00458:25468-26889(+) / protein_length=473 / sequence_SO=supercontig / SO=protein_coding / is_pseudo=false
MQEDRAHYLSNVSGKHIFVTGGMGLVGHHILNILSQLGAIVTCYDISVPRTSKEVNEKSTLTTSNFWSKIEKNGNLKFIKGDILDLQLLKQSSRGQDAVIHLVSRGTDHSSKGEDIEKVNVEGIKNVIECCKHNGIHYLVATSGSTVIFDGKHSHHMLSEELPYPSVFVDFYSETKAHGEKLVLEANNLNGDNWLLTTCLRPGIIYGPGAWMTIGKVVHLAKNRKMLVQIGKEKIPLIHSHDAAYAHVLALSQLLHYSHHPSSNSTKNNRKHSTISSSSNAQDSFHPSFHETVPLCAGKAYFVHDGHPRNIVSWCSPLLQSLHLQAPKVVLPSFLGKIFVFLATLLCFIKNFCLGFLKTVFPCCSKQDKLKNAHPSASSSTPLQLSASSHEQSDTIPFFIRSTVECTYSISQIEHDLNFFSIVTPERGLAELEEYYKQLLEVEELAQRTENINNRGTSKSPGIFFTSVSKKED